MRLAMAALASLLTIAPAAADQAFPAKLAGHAMLPALSFFDPPADAPADLAVSGKFTAADRKRIDAVGVVMGTSFISAKEAPHLPYSSGRALGRHDDNELILVEAAEFLKAK